ncbi:hypothetical protein [Nocardia wallacei]|uniref:hypothetical protein n=1 Tax=Nocardia wallacei TaxID=480035 RepID=UPI00245500E0|nr:hypothetical protein [Nocardia wallacei]
MNTPENTADTVAPSVVYWAEPAQIATKSGTTIFVGGGEDEHGSGEYGEIIIDNQKFGCHVEMTPDEFDEFTEAVVGIQNALHIDEEETAVIGGASERDLMRALNLAINTLNWATDSLGGDFNLPDLEGRADYDALCDLEQAFVNLRKLVGEIRE